MGTLFLTSLILFGLTLLITASGFRRVVYFVSIGYAFAIASMAVVTILLFRQRISTLPLLHNLLLLGWGLRLGIFLLRREFQPSFQKQARQTNEQYGRVSPARKAMIWPGVSLLYVGMFLPGLVSAAAPQFGGTQTAKLTQTLGLALMLGGLAIEALADRQKSAFKERFPGLFCNTGLYGWVRCPNYLGEILFWLGNWVMGTAFFATPLQWAASLLALVCLVLIMFGSTRRLERAQDLRYGADPQYQNYVHRVPVLFPFVPLYTLKKIRVYLE